MSQLGKYLRGEDERTLLEKKMKAEGRLPPGQALTIKWPVLHTGGVPTFDPATWDFRAGGLVEEPLSLRYDAFMALPHAAVVSDFHCVTRWSTFDNRWEGVSFRHIMSVVRPLPTARFVLFSSYDGYTTNLPLEACDDEDVLLTCKWNAEPLPKEHGGPVRVIVPKRYAWKGAKWVKEITFAEQDKPGFWEVRGYSNTALPWEEDRYGY